jgi:hypothetical protein
MNRAICVAMAILAAFAAGSANAGMIIDDFSTPAGQFASSNVNGLTVSSVAAATVTIGGVRQIDATSISGASGTRATEGVVDLGEYSHSQDAGSTPVVGRTELIYDGDITLGNQFALGGIDLTEGGTVFYFCLTNLASDLDTQLTWQIFSDGGATLSETSFLVAAGGPTNYVVAFATLVGTADITSVDAIKLIINSNPGSETAALDITIDNLKTISAIPEPASMAVWGGLGALGLAIRAIRRRKAA